MTSTAARRFGIALCFVMLSSLIIAPSLFPARADAISLQATGSGDLSPQSSPSDITCVYQVVNKALGQRSYIHSSDYRAFDKLNDLDNITTTSYWEFERLAWYAPKSSKTPVYRLWNKKSRSYRFTTSAKEVKALKSKGWRNKEILCYSDDAKSKPVYRLYSGKLPSNQHRYTTSKATKAKLQKKGWKYKGVAWYASKEPGKVAKDVFVGDWDFTRSSPTLIGDAHAALRANGLKHTLTVKKNGTCIRRILKKSGKGYKQTGAQKMKWVQYTVSAKKVASSVPSR